ncbi:MAG: diacylglycerol kinase family protein [Pseudomonadales bacterium]
MLKTILIGNPASGAGRLIGALELPGHWVRDPSRIDADACLDADLIALFGGDGTVQKTVSSLLATIPCPQLPPVAVLPFGTTNMTAANLNCSRSRAAAVRSLRWMIEHEQLTLQSRPLLRIVHGEVTEHGFFFGLGAIATAVQAWNQDRRAAPLRNRLRSAAAVLQGLRTANASHPIAMNGSELDLYALLTTTLDRLLLGCRPYWGEALAGPLRMTWIDAGTPNLLARAPALLRGSPRMAQRAGFHSSSPARVQLGLNGPFILDGEIKDPQSNELTVTATQPLKWVTL